ncbi:isochorismatase family protein [Enterococcus faecalis 13-SD-W-01]|nr:isochorismatase family protein [Enterococcus faecalis 13-SD-W-01]
MSKNTLDLHKTAFVPIDMQKGILNGTLVPYPVESVLEKNNQIAAALKNTPALLALVNVDVQTFHLIGSNKEQTMHSPMQVPADFTTFALPIASDPEVENVVEITKYNPSAFYGTSLDLQLRRRGIDTLILTGVATANGVYATALDAYQRGYNLILVEDACGDRDEDLHRVFFQKLFPKIADIRTTAELLTIFDSE